MYSGREDLKLLMKMESSKHCLTIDKRLLPVKVHYFLFMAAISIALPFRTVFAKQLGISATEVGVIFCVMTFIRVVTSPLFGFLFDYFKKIRLTISVIMITVAVSHLAMICIPFKTSTTHNNVTSSDFYTKVKYACDKRNFSYVSSQKLLMYSEYKITDRSATGRSNFVCDIQCSDPTCGFTMDNVKNMQQCGPEIMFELNVFVDIVSCKMDIRLEKGELITTNDNVQNSMPINGSSIRLFKSRISSFENCSGTTEKVPRKTDQSYEVDEFDNENLLAEPENKDSEKIKYYVLHEYVISTPLGDFINNISVCNSIEFDCRTRQCFPKTQQDESNSPTLLAESNEFLSLQFWSLFVLFVISGVTFSAVLFLMDSVCHELLQNRRDQYGKQRLFGAIGWGIGALVGGFLNQIASTDSGKTNYTPSFCLLALLIIIDLYPVNQLKVTNLEYSPHILKDVCFLFTKVDIVYNLVTVFIIGNLTGFIWNYQFWFMQEIGSGQVLLGLSQTFESICELPFFFMSGWILSKIGHGHCNSITLLCFGLRYLCFVFMYNPWWTLAVGLLHGPTYGLFLASVTTYAKKKAPPGTEATVQSLLHLSFEGAGTAVGSMLGGIGFDVLGSRTSFLCAAGISFFMLVINILVNFCSSRKKESEQIQSAFPSS